MTMADRSKAYNETLNPIHNRLDRYNAGLKLIPDLITKDYPSVRVVKILNRAGVKTDETDFGSSLTRLGTVRQKSIDVGLADQPYFETIEGGPNLEKTMDKYGEAIDLLLESETDPYQIAAWAFLMLGLIHPVSGTGRTQRLLANYILQKKNLPLFNFPLIDGHLSPYSMTGYMISSFSSIISDESDKTGKTKQQIIDMLISNAHDRKTIESGIVGELAHIFRNGEEK